MLAKGKCTAVDHCIWLFILFKLLVREIYIHYTALDHWIILLDVFMRVKGNVQQ